jgi:hypothetical protein
MTARTLTYAELCATTDCDADAADPHDKAAGCAPVVRDRAKELFESHPSHIHIHGVILDESRGEWRGIAAHPGGTTVEGVFTGLKDVRDAQIAASRREAGGERQDTAFSGTVVNGAFEGPGTYVSSRLSYSGQFACGIPCGEGEYTESPAPDETGGSPSSSYIYDGYPSYASSEGEGDITYSGTWSEGKLDGESCCVRRAGYEYRGGYKAGRPHGNGVEIRRCAAPQRFVVRHDQGTRTECLLEAEQSNKQLRGMLAESPGVCKICFAVPATNVFKPCRHLCVCESCFRRLRDDRSEGNNNGGGGAAGPGRHGVRCPICRAVVDEVVRGILA